MSEPRESRPRLLFCPAWFPNRFNEAYGQFNLTLARELSEFFDLKVLYVHVHEDSGVETSPEIEQGDGFEILRYYVHRRFRFGPLYPLIYRRHFMEGYRRLYGVGLKPELVFARGVLPGGLGAQVLHRSLGVPFVTIESFSGFGESLASPFKRRWVGRILNAATRNAAVSGYQRDVMLRLFPDVPFEVQTNVIAESPPVNADPGSPGELLKMIYVGNLVPVKGWDLLLEGLRLFLDAHGIPLRLTIAGSGDIENVRRTIDRLNLGDVVDFIGWQPHEKIRELISQHHFLVLPSRVDTSPNVVLESMMEGRPVLATRSGGAQDMITPTTGHLVNKDSAEALSEGIGWMAEHVGEFNSSVIRQHVIEHHSLRSLVGFLVEAIDRAAGATDEGAT